MGARLDPLLPSSAGRSGKPLRDRRQVLEGIVFRYRTGCAWRDLPSEFGPRQTVWKRHHRYSADRTWDVVLALLLAEADAAGELDWVVSIDSSVIRPRQHAATARRSPAPAGTHTGATPNDKNPGWRREEPPDHGIGRSRGGLSSKVHLLADGRGRPLVISVTAGQAGDSPMFTTLLEQLSVARPGPGRPRTRPEAVLGDRAYSSRRNRALLRSRGIKAVIPEPRDQAGHRRRNVVERAFNRLKSWR